MKKTQIFFGIKLKHCIFFLLCSLKLQAQTYEGTLGHHPIFLELHSDSNDKHASATYFYKSKLKNIDLYGSFNTSELFLYEKFTDREEQKELFKLFLNKNKLSGTWQSNGNTLKVDLTRTTKNLANYKLSKLQCIKDSISNLNEKELIWFTEKYSKQAMFRIGHGFTISEREFMNAKLNDIHINYALTQLNCIGMEVKIELELISDQYLSFTEYSSANCGGAHPSHHTIGFNFDYKNNLEIDTLTAIYPKIDIFQVLKEKYGNDAYLQPECDYFTSGKELWDYYTWVMTKDGITITPSYPHVLTPCEIGFPLTYKELEQNNKD